MHCFFRFTSLMVILSLFLSTSLVYATETDYAMTDIYTAADGSALDSSAYGQETETEEVLAIAPIEYPTIGSPYALLLDATSGQALFAQGALDRTYPAATTKIMTGLLVVEAIEAGTLAQDQMIACTPEALEGMGSSGVNIVEGECLSVVDLLHCMLLASSNQSANMLAIAVAGSEEAFVDLMNQRAQALGCYDTQFTNAHGIHDDNHYTTAYDVALTLQAAMTHPLFAQIVATETYTTAPTAFSEERVLYSANGLLTDHDTMGYVYPQVLGGTVGYTANAGYCMAVMAQEGDSVWICVIMGCEKKTFTNGTTYYAHFHQATTLLDWGFTHYETIVYTPESDSVGVQGVSGSYLGNTVPVVVSGDLYATVPVGLTVQDMTFELGLEQATVPAPVAQGQVVGRCVVSYGDWVYGTLDLVAQEALEVGTEADVAQKVTLQDEGVVTALLWLGFGSLVLVLLVVGMVLLFVRTRKQTSPPPPEPPKPPKMTITPHKPPVEAVKSPKAQLKPEPKMQPEPKAKPTPQPAKQPQPPENTGTNKHTPPASKSKKSARKRGGKRLEDTK